ncbi:unnamed protein product [Cuscuta europaea]|uniref:Uncharacterized protein n=1 Tax=Cuscuta europaea TaxID=41803 RepID=A0A9P1EK56_CUSEU|nr:unnamed protein product [Cuscuta europaea]
MLSPSFISSYWVMLIHLALHSIQVGLPINFFNRFGRIHRIYVITLGPRGCFSRHFVVSSAKFIFTIIFDRAFICANKRFALISSSIENMIFICDDIVTNHPLLNHRCSKKLRSHGLVSFRWLAEAK